MDFHSLLLVSVRALLVSVQDAVNYMLHSNQIMTSRLDSMTVMVTALIKKCIAPINAPIAFDLVVKVSCSIPYLIL